MKFFPAFMTLDNRAVILATRGGRLIEKQCNQPSFYQSRLTP